VKLNQAESLALARLCCRALDAKMAGNLKVIDVTDLSSITNYLVIATATSDPHVRALRVELEKALDSAHARIVGVETAGESGWTVMDAFDVMVHIFTTETRARYKLETLWKDGDEIPMKELLSGKAIPAKKILKKPVKTKKKAAARKKKTGK
jgi:ribosome-associated protein